MLSELFQFDASDLLSFIAGALSVISWKNAKVWMWNKTHPEKRLSLPKMNVRWFTYTLISLACISVLLSTYNIQDSHKRFVAETTACQREFRQVVIDRAALNAKYWQLWSAEENLWLAAFSTVTSPPPSIAALSANDERRQQWSIDVGQVFVNQLLVVRGERAKVEKDVQDHPLKDPECGK